MAFPPATGRPQAPEGLVGASIRRQWGTLTRSSNLSVVELPTLPIVHAKPRSGAASLRPASRVTAAGEI